MSKKWDLPFIVDMIVLSILLIIGVVGMIFNKEIPPLAFFLAVVSSFMRALRDFFRYDAKRDDSE